MRTRPARPSFPLRSIASAVSLLVIAGLAATAWSAPVVGFMEHWSTGLDGWSSSDNVSNPGTGGVLGAGDGFLMFSTPGPPPASIENLGAMSSGAAYTGNWQAAGITQVRFWVKDVGSPNPLEMHFAFGDALNGNFWQYNTGFIPSESDWTLCVVDLTSAAAFTQIIGGLPGDTYLAALQNVNRVLIRHDLAPYTQGPDPIVADVGVDELLLTDGTAGVPIGAPRVAAAVQMAPPYPNPSRGPVTVALESFDRAPITIQVVDVAGRVVRHEALAAGAGPRLWTWNGTADDGATAPAGIYRVRAFGRSGGVSRSLVRVAGGR